MKPQLVIPDGPSFVETAVLPIVRQRLSPSGVGVGAPGDELVGAEHAGDVLGGEGGKEIGQE